jgi:hypothetical protein
LPLLGGFIGRFGDYDYGYGYGYGYGHGGIGVIGVILIIVAVGNQIRIGSASLSGREP